MREPRQPPASTDLLVGDHVDVDRSGQLGRGDADARTEHLREPATPAGAEHQLRRVLRAGEVEQRGRDVLADDVVITAAKAFHQRPLSREGLWVRAGETVGPGDVHGKQVGALAAVSDPDGPADQGVPLGATGERDHHPFTGFPGTGDAVLRAVPVELLVHLVGYPQQCNLT